MSKNYLSILLIALSFSMASGQKFNLVSNTNAGVQLELEVPDFELTRQQVNGQDYIDFGLRAKIFTMEAGAPSVPVFTESVQLPDTGSYSVEVVYGEYTDYHNVSVLPSKGSLKRNVNPADIPYSFGSVYAQDAFYPGVGAQTGKPFLFRNVRGLTVSFYPVQYNPVSRTLRIYHELSVSIVYNQEEGENEQMRSRTSETEGFQQMYQSFFINPQWYEPVSETGDLLVVSPPEYVPVLTPWLNWKKEQGIATTLVTTDQTGNSDLSIKSYISDFYTNNPALAFVMLIGDHAQIPAHTYGMPGSEELWSDSYYGQIDGDDFFPELLVGRFSGTVVEVGQMVSRTLEYETEPAQGNWMQNAIGIGSNEGDGYGDDGEPDWQHNRNIRAKLLDFGYQTVYEFYEGSHGGEDADGNPTSAMVVEAINSGVGLLNYTGHGWQEGMVTGDFTNDSVQALSNNGMYPFVVSVACNNGTLTGTSLCEALLSSVGSGGLSGAVAACGSSILMAWAEPMQTQDEMAELITKADPNNEKITLGGLFYNGQISMLEAYSQSGTAEEVMQTWIFFGDPTVLFRSEATINIVASHEEEIPQQGATVNLYTNAIGAVATLTQDGVVVATATITQNDTAFELPDLSALSPVKVTLNQPNAYPYRGEIAVSSQMAVGEFEDGFGVWPNPVSQTLFIKSATVSEKWNISLFDVNGRMLYSQDTQPLNEAASVDMSFLSSGIYLLSVEANGIKTSRKVVKR